MITRFRRCLFCSAILFLFCSFGGSVWLFCYEIGYFCWYHILNISSSFLLQTAVVGNQGNGSGLVCHHIEGAFAFHFQLLLVAKAVAVALSGSISIISSLVDSAVDLLSGVVVWFTSRAVKNSNPYIYPSGLSILHSAACLSLFGKELCFSTFYCPHWSYMYSIFIPSHSGVLQMQKLNPLCWEPRADKCLFQAWSRSKYSHACFSCLSGPFIFIFPNPLIIF